MKVLMTVVAALAMGAAVVPAAAQERRTELVDEGKAVDSLLLRYRFDATWVVDPERILVRDTYREHYLVTLEEPCDWLELQKPFKFFPKLSDRVRASLSYEVRDDQHENCHIAKIEKVPTETARGLRAELAARG